MQYAIFATFMRTLIELIERLWPAFDRNDNYKKVAAFALAGILEAVYRPDGLAGTNLQSPYPLFDWGVTWVALSVSVLFGNDLLKGMSLWR